MRRIATALMLLSLAATAPARADDATASLTIAVHEVSNAGGQLDIGIYDEAGFKAKHGTPLTGKITAARPGTMTLTIDGIPPGIYAVKMFQDVNRNGYFDFGIRLAEPYGFSNDPASPLPSFDDAKISLHPGANSIDVTLH
jgi:uncharacterized protein (DUF2141 family)